MGLSENRVPLLLQVPFGGIQVYTMFKPTWMGLYNNNNNNNNNNHRLFLSTAPSQVYPAWHKKTPERRWDYRLERSFLGEPQLVGEVAMDANSVS